MEWWGWLLIALGALSALLLVIDFATRAPRFSLRGKVVAVTGGSSGIGKAVALEALKRGAHLILLARRLDVLKQAQDELRTAASADQRVTVHSVDVTDDGLMAAALESAAKAHGGRIDALVCSAGTSCPREFESMPAPEFESVLKCNVMGTRNAVAAVLPHMGRGVGGGGGRIVFISSQAGQVGLYGYTAYSASKFALQGFAQALSMELHARGILVSVAFPPDTDTPLLASENLQKPRITRLLSEATVTVSPETVARGILEGMEVWSPAIPVGFDGWMLSTLTSGMGPAGSLGSALVQVCTMGLWRLVSLVYVQDFYRTVKKHDK